MKLGVAYYRRFYPILRRLKQLLQEGAPEVDGHVGREVNRLLAQIFAAGS